MIQVHLSGKRCSGRGVRFRELSASEVEENAENAAKVALDPTAKINANAAMDLKKAEWRMGSKRMVVAVTKKEGLKDLSGAEWMPLTQAELDADWAKYFNAKDSAMLQALYREYHEISDEEIEAVVGKAVVVSED